jgi:hypothetical protein
MAKMAPMEGGADCADAMEAAKTAQAKGKAKSKAKQKSKATI